MQCSFIKKYGLCFNALNPINCDFKLICIIITVITIINNNKSFYPMAGFVHILPKIGLKQPSIFLECT